MKFQVTVDGFQFRGWASQAEGFTIAPNAWSGWEDGVEVRAEDTPIATGDGSFDVDSTLGARIISIGGTCWSESEARTAYLGRRMKSLLANGPGRLVVEQYGETTWAPVRWAPGVKPQFQARGYDPRIADFAIQLKSAKPYIFGSTQIFGPGTEVTAFHLGNYSAAPVITVSGNMSGYVVNGPDGFYQVTKPVVAGHPHVIDMETGRLTIDGVRIFGAVVLFHKWRIPADTDVLQVLYPSSGTGQMTVTVTDTST